MTAGESVEVQLDRAIEQTATRIVVLEGELHAARLTLAALERERDMVLDAAMGPAVLRDPRPPVA